MRILNQTEIQLIRGGDGKFRVIVNADVSKECALFVSNLYEQVLVGKLSYQTFYQSLLSSSFPRNELQDALNGLDVMHWH